MDYPEVITDLAILDGVPILETLERRDVNFAQARWHWFFFGQPEKPERAILADPDSVRVDVRRAASRPAESPTGATLADRALPELGR
jgi:hypothetical protein